MLAIPVSTVPISPLTHDLGGQHGEEAKDEDEDGGEKDCAQDQAQKEEVGQSRFTVFDFKVSR